ARGEAPRHAVERRDKPAPADGSEVAPSGLRAGILGVALGDLTEVAAVPGLHLPQQAFRLGLLVLLDFRSGARRHAAEDGLAQPDRAGAVRRVRLIRRGPRADGDQLVVIMLPPELGDVRPVGLE